MPTPAHSSQERVREGYRRFNDTCLEISRLYESPFFVKVGANDGLTGDPCSKMLLDAGVWRGMLVEPVPYLFDILRENFSDPTRFQLVQAAIGTQESTTPFFYVDPTAERSVEDLPEWYDRIGGFSRDHLTRQLGSDIDPFIKRLELQVVALGDLVNSSEIASIELLHIDVEGFDFEVLKSHDFESHGPLTILVEQKHVSANDRAAMLAFLEEHRYHTFPFGGEVFALRRDAPAALLRAGRF